LSEENANGRTIKQEGDGNPVTFGTLPALGDE